MRVRYDPKFDRYIDLRRGICGAGMHGFMLDEFELGGRVASALDEEDQSWWALFGPKAGEEAA